IRFTCRAFSRAIAAKSESASSSFRSRASNPSGPTQLISSITPKQVSRNFTGTATIERVSIFVFSSTLPKNRVSFEVSGTITISPCCATHPAIPCPTLTRTSFSACEALPTASSKYNSCFGSSSSSNDQLSGRRNSSIFSMMVRRTWSSCSEEVSALPNSWKTATSPASRCSEGTPGFRRRSTVGNCLISSTLTEVGFSGWCETLQLRCLPGHQVSTPVPANLGQYRRRSKVRASRPWYRRSHFAILSRAGAAKTRIVVACIAWHQQVLPIPGLFGVSHFRAGLPREANDKHDKQENAGNRNRGGRQKKIHPESLN